MSIPTIISVMVAKTPIAVKSGLFEAKQLAANEAKAPAAQKNARRLSSSLLVAKSNRLNKTNATAKMQNAIDQRVILFSVQLGDRISKLYNKYFQNKNRIYSGFILVNKGKAREAIGKTVGLSYKASAVIVLLQPRPR